MRFDFTFVQLHTHERPDLNPIQNKYQRLGQKRKKRFVSGFKPQKKRVGRSAIFFSFFFFFFDTLVQLPKEHLVKQTSRKSYKAFSAIACNF